MILSKFNDRKDESLQTRRQKVRQAAIDEIKSLAWDIANKKGLEAVTINAITNRMGMTSPAFYSYFKSRDALMRSLLFDTYDLYQKTMETARDSISEENVGDRIMILLLTYRKWAITHPAAFSFFAGRLTPGFYPPDEKIVKMSEKAFFIWQSAFYKAWEKGVLELSDHVLKLPKLYKMELKKFSDNLNMKIPTELIHIIIHFPILAHGLVSIELTGRYGYLIDFGQLYKQKIIHELKQIGIEPNLTSLKL